MTRTVKLVLILLSLLTLTACNPPSMSNASTISLTTVDNVSIVGSWSLPEGAKRAVLLLHMMPATRESWDGLAAALNEAGMATLALDLRGHGASTTKILASGEKELLDYRDFPDERHQKSRLDIDAALNFLKSHGFDEEHISLAGASIGANLALDAMQRYCCLPRGVLLSPGLDYRGVTVLHALKGLRNDQKIWSIAARGDSYSAQTTEELQKADHGRVTITIFEGSEHGTSLFAPHPELMEQIVDYLKGS